MDKSRVAISVCTKDIMYGMVRKRFGPESCNLRLEGSSWDSKLGFVQTKFEYTLSDLYNLFVKDVWLNFFSSMEILNL